MTTLARSRLSLSTLVWMACIVAGSLAACTQDFGRYHFLPDDDAGVSGGTTGTGGAAGASATGGSTSSGGSGSGGASAGTAGNAGAR